MTANNFIAARTANLFTANTAKRFIAHRGICLGTPPLLHCVCFCDGCLFGLFGVGVVGVFAAAPAVAGLPSKVCVGFWRVVVFLCGWCCLFGGFVVCDSFLFRVIRFWFSLVLFFAGRVCGVCVGCFVFGSKRAKRVR